MLWKWFPSRLNLVWVVTLYPLNFHTTGTSFFFLLSKTKCPPLCEFHPCICFSVQSKALFQDIQWTHFQSIWRLIYLYRADSSGHYLAIVCSHSIVNNQSHVECFKLKCWSCLHMWLSILCLQCFSCLVSFSQCCIVIWRWCHLQTQNCAYCIRIFWCDEAKTTKTDSQFVKAEAAQWT